MAPARGEVWYADLTPVRGHEQDGVRPVVVLSTRERLPIPLALAVPVTTRFRDIPSHVPIHPPEGGLRSTSYALCEQTRCLALERFQRRLGRVEEDTLKDVSHILHYLMALHCPKSGDEEGAQLSGGER
jgi:mRNA interferase MazF